MIDIDFARLNHILIPSTRTGRDRLRNGRLGRLARPFLWPYGRLTPEGFTVGFLVLLTAALGLDVEGSAAYLLFCPLAGLFAASLVASWFYPLDRVRLEVRSPARVLPGEAVCFEVTLINDGPVAYGPIAVTGPFLPWDGAYDGPRPTLPGLSPFGRATAVYRARFVARGAHQLDAFRAGALVPFALTTGRHIEDSGVKFTVIPRPARVVALPAQRPTATAQHAGTRAAMARAVSDARELRGVRPYRPGDRVRDLHARRWARTGTPVVREYQPELDPRVAVLVSLSRPGTVGAQREAVLSLAAGVLARLTQEGASVSLWIDGAARRSVELDPGRSPDAALDALGETEPRERSAAPSELSGGAWLAGCARGPRPCARALIVGVLRADSSWADSSRETLALLDALERAGCDAHAVLVARGGRSAGEITGELSLSKDPRVRIVSARSIAGDAPVDLS